MKWSLVFAGCLIGYPLIAGAQEAAPASAPAQSSNYFNPRIGLIGNFLGVVGSNRTENLPAAELRESELSLQADVDPYARADFFLAFGEEEVELEEGFITFTALPWGLLAKVGRMRAAFGKTNTLHLHSLPWPDRPLPLVNLLGGEEGWIGTGVSVAKLLPLPGDVFSELTLQIFRGDAEDLFESPEERREVAYNGHYRIFVDLDDSTNIDLGLAHGGGPNAATRHSDTRLSALDVTLRWKPLRRARYRSATFRGEYLRSRREDDMGAQRSSGWFVSGEYQLARRWFVGGRYERSDRAAAASLRDRGGAAALTFRPSEFSLVRGEVRRRLYADGETADEVLVQIQFAIGAHGAHPF